MWKSVCLLKNTRDNERTQQTELYVQCNEHTKFVVTLWSRDK